MKIFKILFALTAVLAISLPSFGQVSSLFPNNQRVAQSAQASGSTIASVIISANAYNGGCPVLTYYNATSDKAGSKLQAYICDTNQTANYANSTVTLPVGATNGFASGDIIVIRHMRGDTYERRVLTTSTGTTNLVTTVAPTTAVAVGDQIYHCITTGAPTVAVGNATVTSSGNSLIAGQPSCPLLIDLDGTSACSINCITADFKLPAR